MTKQDLLDIVLGRHFLVPVAMAESAQIIIDLALTLMEPREGYITVLGKPPTGTEDAASNYKRIAGIVQAYQNEGYPIRLRTKITGTFSRSILEAIREWAVDAVLLPVYRSTEFEGPSMRSVIENIVATTPCQVLMYRHALAEQFNQIVVPVLHENEVDLARDYSEFLSARLEKPAEILPYQGRFDQKYEADETLLGIVVSGQSNWETWQDIIAEDQRIFGDRNGLLVLFLPEGKVDPLTSWDKFKNWLNPKVAPYEESELVALQHESGVVSLD
jgi:nucleotide-binding universal stress UspA family protein